jgi:Leucine-rich repeat (LRR) protein
MLEGMSAMNTSLPPHRRRFQFSLRSLLLLLTLCAVLPCWKFNRVWNQRMVVAEIQRRCPLATIEYDYQDRRLGTPPSPPGPAWARSVLGDDFFTNVTELTIAQPGLDDALLRQIAKLSGVKTLDTNSNQVTDAGLAHVASMRNLETFSFVSENVTDAGLAHLQSLKRIKHLSFTGPKITDMGLQRISEITQIEDLGIDSDRITDDGLVYLAKLPRLEVIGLFSAHRITDTGLEILSKLKNLKVLCLYESQITNAGLESLVNLKNLTSIALKTPRITDRGMSVLAKLGTLEYITLDSSITDDGLLCLHALPNLKYLSLHGSDVTQDGAHRFVKALPNCQLVWKWKNVNGSEWPIYEDPRNATGLTQVGEGPSP